MVGVSFKGRMGNQLFQFYFYLYLKAKYKHKFIFLPNPHHAYFIKYFDLGPYYDIILGSKIYSLFARSLPKIFKLKNVYFENFVRRTDIEVQENTIYNGYFQTDWYVKYLPSPPAMKLKKQYQEKFDQLYGEVFSNSKTIVVHIRRTDYLSYGKRDISLPMEYFKTRLEAIENVDSYKVFFVSDDMEHVKATFTQKPNFIFASNDEITDFQLIRSADIAIISNSTFSWWAAYLSEKKNIVHAPKNWFGFRMGVEHPKGIMTDRFIWHDVLAH